MEPRFSSFFIQRLLKGIFMCWEALLSKSEWKVELLSHVLLSWWMADSWQRMGNAVHCLRGNVPSIFIGAGMCPLLDSHLAYQESNVYNYSLIFGDTLFPGIHPTISTWKRFGGWNKFPSSAFGPAFQLVGIQFQNFIQIKMACEFSTNGGFLTFKMLHYEFCTIMSLLTQ